MKEIEIIKPDDWHLHLRDEPVLKDTLKSTVRSFARAVIMPNLKPPVATIALMNEYRTRIMNHLADGESFEPLMTLYLTDSFTPADVQKAKKAGTFAMKLYPAGATTNSEMGLSSIENAYTVFEAMEKAGMPLLIHGEVTDPEVDFFDREKVFLERHFQPIIKRFPSLKIVLEHTSTADAVDLIKQMSDNVAATVTPHHMELSRNDLFAGGLNSHHFCLPVVKTERDRQAIVDAVISGHPRFFAGTDSAPHPVSAKTNARAAGGIYCAPVALEIWATIFEKHGVLDRLESFVSRNGAIFHGLPLNKQKITLVKSEWTVPAELPFGETKAIPFYASQTIPWMIKPQ